VRVEVPRKLLPLLQPKRYKGAYGGRGGAKSHFFAEQIILRCYRQKTRVVCIREVQDTIKDSVKQLLSDKIAKLGLEASFQVLDTEIRAYNGSLIIFKGMQSYNADNIKSLEAYDIAWVEEAQTLSQHSLDMLRPTIRKEGSELWFSWNPRHKTDPVDVFFRKYPPPDAISVQVNWRDNPWFPDVLRKEMEHDFATDPDKAEHIWNGAYGAGIGSILSKWVSKAEREGRIIEGVDYDREGAPIHISSDLGYRDTASWWFWQPKVGGFSIFDYDQDIHMDAEDWIPRLMGRIESHGVSRAKLGKIWLPHDAKIKTFQTKHSTIEQFVTAFGSDKVSIVPQSKKADQISAARSIIDRCEFHKTRCERGVDGLMAWEFEWNEELNIFSRDPVHNWASHPSDAYAYGCQMMRELVVESTQDKPIRGLTVGNGHGVTLDEMWQSVKPASRRI